MTATVLRGDALHRMCLDFELPSGVNGHGIVARDVIGVAVKGQACLAHHGWMDAAQLRQVSQAAADLANVLDRLAGGQP